MINIDPKTDLLLIVDVQNDFIDGSLSVKDAAEIVPILNKYIEKIPKVAVSRDWHPGNHMSFVGQGGPWPSHCVAGTRGAELHKDLNADLFEVIVLNKATNPNVDAYSAFDGTHLDVILQDLGIKRLFIGGLATDYCVKATVLDALKINTIDTFLLMDAIKSVNIKPGDGDKAVEEIVEAGAFPMTFAEIA